MWIGLTSAARTRHRAPLHARRHPIVSIIEGMFHRLNVLLRGERYLREQDEELRFHLELDH